MALSEKQYKVYMHEFPNGKKYVGITMQDSETRWQRGNGYVRNKYMARAIKKYGWDNITHKILFDGLTKDEACLKECSLILKYKTNQKEYGYNIESGGTTPSITEETKEKLRQAHLGRKDNAETIQKKRDARIKYLNDNPIARENNKKYFAKAVECAVEVHRIPVIQMDDNNVPLATYPSFRAAGRAVGRNHKHISRACADGSRCAGYRWVYGVK